MEPVTKSALLRVGVLTGLVSPKTMNQLLPLPVKIVAPGRAGQDRAPHVSWTTSTRATSASYNKKSNMAQY